MTTLPEEAVKAVIGVPVYGPYLSKAEAVEIIEAALPFLPVQGAVKKLEWRKGRAETPFGPYHVIEETNDDEPFWFVMFNGKAVARCGTHDDEESAIFAAQADYEARILSALEPSAARELALEEGYRQGVEAAAQKAAEMLVFADTTSTADREIPAAIRALGTSREQLNKAVSNVPDQQENEPGAHGERERVLEEAAHNAAMYLATGFISCPRCGEDVETKNTDAEYTLRAALSSPGHADAGKVEGDGWLPIESAPRDRTSVIIAVPAKEKQDGFIVGEAYFDPENYEGGDWWWAATSHTDHFDSPISEINHNAPSHWRPMPLPPVKGGDRHGE